MSFLHENVTLFVTIALMLVIIFSQFQFVDAITCNGRGYQNASDTQCVCISPYYGANCLYKRCPFGESWLSVPTTSHVRNTPLVPCSNMGHCNPHTGTCSCRPGYVGRACERWACPTTIREVVTKSSNGTSVTDISQNSDPLTVPVVCSGHGICRSMREMGTHFDGMSLVRPPVYYANWDADKLQGCVCDYGWEGHDCSYKRCPWGRDPQDTRPWGVNQKYYMQCSANAGYFSIFIMGAYTPPIPYDADPGLLKYLLEQNERVGKVRVIMETDSNGLPVACSSSSSSPYTTTIILTDKFGPLPPISLHYNNTQTSRQFSGSSTSLSLSSSTPVLQMLTIQQLACPVCASCTGYIYFKYKGSLSAPIDITSTSAKTTIASEISSLTDLANEKWPSLSVAVTGTYTSVCKTTVKSVLVVKLTSTYGPLPPIEMLDNSFYSTAYETYTYSANLTWTNSSGADLVYECSNQGYCDRELGICKCLSASVDGTRVYQAMSSNGRGNAGSKGDCGYVKTDISSCYTSGNQVCSGHGVCYNTTGTCDCYNGWLGITCAIRHCAKGPAWTDEPISSSEAHQLTECSNRGMCDRRTGDCVCAEGFSGKACQIKNCEINQATGMPCNGNGRCMSMASFFSMHGLQYGNRHNNRLYPAAWDAFGIHECICSAYNSTSNHYPSDIRYPAVGTTAMVSGRPAGQPPLPGWSGWDCSQRNCPTGDAIDRRHSGTSAVTEIQRVVCQYQNNTNSTVNFKLKIKGEWSDTIYGYDGAKEIKQAIELTPSIRNVSVWFGNETADLISSACSKQASTYFGGFFVEFTSNPGDIPMMTYSGFWSGTKMHITEYRKGTQLNLECSGESVGICDRNTGKCICSGMYQSSNSSNFPGNRGDCGYYSSIVTEAKALSEISGIGDAAFLN